MNGFWSAVRDFFKMIDNRFGLSIPAICRWICLLPVLGLTFIATGVATGLLSGLLGIESVIWVGVACAFTWVRVSYFMAPQQKIIISIVSWIAGAGVAALFITTFPFGRNNLLDTIIELGATCLSGLAAVATTIRIEADKEGGLEKSAPWLLKIRRTIQECRLRPHIQ